MSIVMMMVMMMMLLSNYLLLSLSNSFINYVFIFFIFSMNNLLCVKHTNDNFNTIDDDYDDDFFEYS